jgi:hypothetical protein
LCQNVILFKKIVLQNGKKITTPENQCPGWLPREQLEPNRKLFIDQLPSILHHKAKFETGLCDATELMIHNTV